MLEAQAHHQIKTLLRQEESDWPHHLTLSRLVARSLRRRDTTLVQLPPSSSERWWLGLLVPLCMAPEAGAVVLTAQQRRRLLQLELPRLRNQGLRLPCWQGPTPPEGPQLWLMDVAELIQAHRDGHLGTRQLLIPEMDQLSRRMRNALTFEINHQNWDELRQACPQAEAGLVELHDRMTRQLFAGATRPGGAVRLEGSASQALRDLLQLIPTSPEPWNKLQTINPADWAEWADLDHRLLQWRWQLAPLEPLLLLRDVLLEHPCLMFSSNGDNARLDLEFEQAGVVPDVRATLREQELNEPLPLYAPRRQPLPNTRIYAQHLLEESRRLILGQPGLTILLINDDQLRRQLTSALAAEFGRRVVHQSTAPESNGVVTCSWDWWLEHQEHLPSPAQLIVGMLPLASLDNPLTSARVERLKQQGEDWFRTLLLPEALSLIPAAIAPLRRSGGRLAILDGRLRGRSWGDQILHRLEPWIPLQRLLPE